MKKTVLAATGGLIAVCLVLVSASCDRGNPDCENNKDVNGDSLVARILKLTGWTTGHFFDEDTITGEVFNVKERLLERRAAFDPEFVLPVGYRDLDFTSQNTAPIIKFDSPLREVFDVTTHQALDILTSERDSHFDYPYIEVSPLAFDDQCHWLLELNQYKFNEWYGKSYIGTYWKGNLSIDTVLLRKVNR